MGRTALHYAAAYHEYQDNILYKQLIRAGASEDVIDLVSRVVRECNDCVCVCVCVCVRERACGRASERACWCMRARECVCVERQH